MSSLSFSLILQKKSSIDWAISVLSMISLSSTLRLSIFVVFDLLFSNKLIVFQVSFKFHSL